MILFLLRIITMNIFLKIIKKFENKVLVNKLIKNFFKDYIDKEKKIRFKNRIISKNIFFIKDITL